MKTIINLITVLSVLSIAVYLTSCATITTGTSQLVTITSNVEDADILLDGILIGKTPFTGEIDKNGDIMTIQKEGYKTHQIALSTSIEGAFWGNIIIGGTLGSITDFASGAAYQYSPASYQVELISNEVSVEDFQKKYKLKKFSMINMSNIAIDLSNKGGQYLNSLFVLANLEENAEARELIKVILVNSDGDQVTFGKEVVKLLKI